MTKSQQAQLRFALYVLVTLAGAGLAAYQATQGDWIQVAAAVVAAATSLLAAANVDKHPEE